MRDLSDDSAPRRAALVVNTRSRSGRQMFPEALRLLRALDVPVGATRALDDPAGLAGAVEEVLERGHNLVIIGGGDGSVSSAVDLLAGKEAVLGVLPLGTGNDFARTLEIPLDLEGACETIARGKVVDVDLGLVGDKHYVNVASVGLSVEVTRALSPLLKRTFGALAYPFAAVGAFFRQRPFSATLAFPAGDHPTVALERQLHIAVGNGRFYGGGTLVAAPDSGIDDGALDVCAIELGRRRDLLGLVPYLKSGDFVRSDLVRHYRTRRVRLETDPPLPITADGEVVSRTPQVFSLAPNALKVLIPQGSTAARRDALR